MVQIRGEGRNKRDAQFVSHQGRAVKGIHDDTLVFQLWRGSDSRDRTVAPGRLSWPRGWQRHPGPREGSVRRLSATLPPLSCWISSRNRPPSPRGRGSIPPSTGSRDRPSLETQRWYSSSRLVAQLFRTSCEIDSSFFFRFFFLPRRGFIGKVW